MVHNTGPESCTQLLLSVGETAQEQPLLVVAESFPTSLPGDNAEQCMARRSHLKHTTRTGLANVDHGHETQSSVVQVQLKSKFTTRGSSGSAISKAQVSS